MNNQARGLILWILGALGTMFIYCAYKNVTPASLIASMVNKGAPLRPVDPTASSPVNPATPTTHTTLGGGRVTTGTNTTPPDGAMLGGGNNGGGGGR